MTIREMDEMIINGVTAEKIYAEINRLEGRMDFLMFCPDLPADVKEKEMAEADKLMTLLQAKLMIFSMRKEL